MNANLPPLPHAGKFAPKLPLSDQCAAFALHHVDRRPVSELAFVFGVAVPTMIKICRTYGNGPYKRVRSEMSRLGLQDMYKQYVTEGHIELLNRKSTEREELRNNKQLESRALTKPSPTHKRKQGIHLSKKLTRFEILPFDDGWWISEIDSTDPTPYKLDDEGRPFLTSDAAFAYAMRTLS